MEASAISNRAVRWASKAPFRSRPRPGCEWRSHSPRHSPPWLPWAPRLPPQGATPIPWTCWRHPSMRARRVSSPTFPAGRPSRPQRLRVIHATLNLCLATPAPKPGGNINNHGLFTFATGQSFPGAGTISGCLTAEPHLAGGGASGGGSTLRLATARRSVVAMERQHLGGAGHTEPLPRHAGRD